MKIWQSYDKNNFDYFFLWDTVYRQLLTETLLLDSYDS